jgi:hypothetical protein
MPRNITQYDLLISCPDDVVEEVDIIKNVVANFNQQFSNSLGITIRPRHWGTSAYPQSGDKPQNLLNEQFVKDCDAAVAIFWTKFGTPTDEFKSGSEEEIEIMIKAGKQVFLYFCEIPVKPGYDEKQYKLVQAFKKKYSNKGLYYSYDSLDLFKEQFNAHLTQYFLTKKQLDTIDLETKPELSLKSISEDGEIQDSVIVQKYIVPNPMPADKRIERIKAKFEKINSIHLCDKKNISTKSGIASILSTYSINNNVIIEESTQKNILGFAKVKNIFLNADFFNLGDLQEDIVSKLASGVHGGGVVLRGLEEEKQKYYAIHDLEREINDYAIWDRVENIFSNMFIIQLVVENAGNNFDEDISIEIISPISMFLMPDELPKFNYLVFKTFTKDYKFIDLFSIKETEKYSNYDSSVKERKIIATPLKPSFMERGNWFENRYQAELNEAFCYTIFEKEDKCIVRLHMDYIKQHTVVAFPTPLFIDTTQLSEKITYRIVSKNNPDIVEGELFIRVYNSNI